jgi:hypothetical protein
MAKPKVKLNLRGINALMRSAPVQAEVARRLQRGAAAAGEGFEAVVKPHQYTARGFVQTADAEGRRREADEKVLIQALDAMR